MTEPLNAPHDAALLAEALVSEIKAEMGRQGLSSRGLGELVGHSSQYMSMRLDGGNPKTGKLVTLGVDDLAAIASALGIAPVVLFDRARAVLDGEQ